MKKINIFLFLITCALAIFFNPSVAFCEDQQEQEYFQYTWEQTEDNLLFHINLAEGWNFERPRFEVNKADLLFKITYRPEAGNTIIDPENNDVLSNINFYLSIKNIPDRDTILFKVSSDNVYLKKTWYWLPELRITSKAFQSSLTNPSIDLTQKTNYILSSEDTTKATIVFKNAFPFQIESN